MFDLGYTELLLVGIVALLVVGPKDLPKLMRAAGKMVSKVRATARHFKSGMDEMVRQAELDEMREKWDAHNAAIMARAPGADVPLPKDDGPAKRQMSGDAGNGAQTSHEPEAPGATGAERSSAKTADLGEPTVMPPVKDTGEAPAPAKTREDKAR